MRSGDRSSGQRPAGWNAQTLMCVNLGLRYDMNLFLVLRAVGVQSGAIIATVNLPSSPQTRSLCPFQRIEVSIVIRLEYRAPTASLRSWILRRWAEMAAFLVGLHEESANG